MDISRFRTLEFHARGDGKTYAAMLHRQSVTDGDDFRHLFTAPAEWTLVRLPLAAFAQGGWGTTVAAGCHDVVAIRFGVMAHDEDFSFQVDDIALSTVPVDVAASPAEPAAVPVADAVAGPADSAPAGGPPARIILLHHSTGGVVYAGGLKEWLDRHNSEHGTRYAISERAYPSEPYPWHNYPYDYWNLWVNHAREPFQGQPTLDQLAAGHDLVIWKHCFPVSDLEPDNGNPDVASERKTPGNYRAQYTALRQAMRRFPRTRFLVWTGAALTRAGTSEAKARRAGEFFQWVRDTWDEPGDNIFVWDFHRLETEGGLYLLDRYAAGPDDAHPSPAFARRVAPLLGRRIVEILSGRGDAGSLTGE